MRRTISIVGGLALGLCFSQFPEYAQQYEQRLGGAVDELKTIVADFDRDATRFGLSRGDALKRYAVSPDDFLVARGTSMDKTLARYTQLSAMLVDLQTAGPLERAAHLGDYLDTDVGARALQTYKPAVPVTIEGFAWGLAGWVIGYLLVFPLLGFFSLPFRWRRGKTPHHRAPLWRNRRSELVVETVPLAQIAQTRARIRAEPKVEPPPGPRVETIPPRIDPRGSARSNNRAETQREIDQRIVREI
jgi:Protein of unknown function (DUF2937)